MRIGVAKETKPLREENLRRLARALDALGAAREDGIPIRPDELAKAESLTAGTRADTLTVLPTPWGTRGYDDLRIRVHRENLGRGIRPTIASVVRQQVMTRVRVSPADSQWAVLGSNQRPWD